jgi:IclR family transcriptional regulator, acetate operon repressor
MLRNAMTVLELFSETRRDVGVTEAAELLGRPKSTTSRWLAAMEEAGFLDREGGHGRYRLGMRLAAFGQLARQSTSLQQLARPCLSALAQATGESSNLVVLAGDVAVNVELVESPRPIKHVGWLGRRLPLHATAAGKALIAWRPAAEVERLVGRRPERLTARTIVDVAALHAELARVRALGWAEAWGELEDDLVGIASPVRDHAGAIVGALTISAPMARVSRKTMPVLAAEVVGAAAALTMALGGRPRPAASPPLRR